MGVEGMGVYLTKSPDPTPPILPRHPTHNKSLQQRVTLLTVAIEDTPQVARSRRVEVRQQEHCPMSLTMRFGFMEQLDDCAALRDVSRDEDIDLDFSNVTYHVGHSTIAHSQSKGRLKRWRDALFMFLSRNSAAPVDYFSLPPDQVFEIGLRIEM